MKDQELECGIRHLSGTPGHSRLVLISAVHITENVVTWWWARKGTIKEQD
jgi:hypothetical protein